MRHISFILIALLFSLCSYGQKQISAAKENGQYVIKIDEQNVVTYQFETYQSPESVDSVFNRSGFIHPLQSLKGHVLTDIQPKDHYHHFGIWNPWTHVLFRKDTLDFWNLAKKQGTVRFTGFTKEKNNGYIAIHEHIVFKNDTEIVALKEEQSVSVTIIDEQSYAIDFTFRYKCATDSPFKILEYRYGGFTFRGTEKWNGLTSEIISSETNVRDEIDGSLAKWCLAKGIINNDYSSVLMLSHTNNYNHPEPLRVWPKATHDGLVFINFSPTKNKDWLLESQKDYILKYRLIVSDRSLTTKEANILWEAYNK